MAVTASPDDALLTGGGAIEYCGCFALPQPMHWKRKHYAAPLHMTVMLIYFTLRAKAYFRVRFPTPSGMDIYGIGTEKEFSDNYLRSVAMQFRSWPVSMRFRRPLLFRSGRFGLPAFCLVHIRLAAFGHLLQLFDLFRGQLGQAPDEGDERPDGFRTVFPAERRHSSKARPVRDDVEKLDVGQSPRIRRGQVGNLRGEIAAIKSGESNSRICAEMMVENTHRPATTIISNIFITGSPQGKVGRLVLVFLSFGFVFRDIWRHFFPLGSGMSRAKSEGSFRYLH